MRWIVVRGYGGRRGRGYDGGRRRRRSGKIRGIACVRRGWGWRRRWGSGTSRQWYHGGRRWSVSASGDRVVSSAGILVHRIRGGTIRIRVGDSLHLSGNVRRWLRLRHDTVLRLALLLSYHGGSGSGSVLASRRRWTAGVLNDRTVARVLIARPATATGTVLRALTADHSILIALTGLTSLTTATVHVTTLSVVPVKAVLTGRRVLIRILTHDHDGSGHVGIRILIVTGRSSAVLITLTLCRVDRLRLSLRLRGWRLCVLIYHHRGRRYGCIEVYHRRRTRRSGWRRGWLRRWYRRSTSASG